jgi:hypothetical protein
MTLPTKKPNCTRPDFADAHKACRTPAEREQLARTVQDGWTPVELTEFARLHFFKNGRDYATPQSYRRAIADIAGNSPWLSYAEAEPGYGRPNNWLKLFREGGSKPLPPRREGLLQRGRGLTDRINEEEYAWPGHTEEFRSMIEQQARDYFGIAPEQPVHVNAWAASQRAYDREQQALAEALRKETEAITLSLSPKSRENLPKGSRRKLAQQFDYDFMGRPKLKPHFNYEFAGHTEAFREEVAALARKDKKGQKPDAYISPRSWKIACHKHYVLIEKHNAHVLRERHHDHPKRLGC